MSGLKFENGRALPLKELTLTARAAVRVWLAGPADPCEIPQQLWDALSSGEKERAGRYHRVQDQALFALTRGSLRYVLSAAMGVPPQDIAFAEGPYGKPYLAGHPAPHFNVSHSGSLALIGVSPSRPVGVDIELVRGAGDEIELAKAFFTQAEHRTLEGLPHKALMSSFYKIWTCKEAVLKASGRGITEHLKDFSVELTKDGYAIRPEPLCPAAIAAIAAWPVEVPEGYAGCYALA